MSELFGDFKRPRAELKVIENFIQIFEKSKEEYNSKNYVKAISDLKESYEILKDIYDVLPKVVVLYLIIKCKFKLNEYNNFELYLSELDNYIKHIIKFKKDIFIKCKSKIFLYGLVYNFALDNIDKSINIVIQMIEFLKESKILSLEEKVYSFWIFLKNFIKIGVNIQTRKFLYFKEQYNSILVEEENREKKYYQGIEIKEKKIYRGFLHEYKTYMNSKIRQNIYENLDKKFYYFKYGKTNNKIMYFLNRNMEFYIKSDSKDKLIEKFNNYLLVTRINLNEEFNVSMTQLIQEQKRRILGFNMIFANIVGAFHNIFNNHFTEKEVTFRQIANSKSSTSMFGHKEIKEIEEKLISHRRTIKTINLNEKKVRQRKLNSLSTKEITLPYNFKSEISVPPIIINGKETFVIKSKKNNYFLNINETKKLPFTKKNYKNIIIRHQNEENKNIIPNFGTKRRIILNRSQSLINISRNKKWKIPMLSKDKINNKTKKENYNEKFIYRNINYYFISKLIEIYGNMLKSLENNIGKNFTEKYNKLFPRKIDLFNVNMQNSIKEYNVFSIKGTNSPKDNQDNYFFYEDFLLIKNFYLFGVCDGHGKFGEEISNAVSFLLPSYINYILIEDNLNKRKQDLNDMILNLFKLEEPPKEVKDIFLLKYIFDKFQIINEFFPFLTGDMKLLFHLLYETCFYIQMELVKRYHIDIELSGTTLCSGFLLGKVLYIANIGDSRVIMGKFDSNYNKWSCQQLSNDHIPMSSEENKRIMSMNGKIEKIKNEIGEDIGPFLIFEKDKDSGLPGIPMSRSIGDLNAKKLGVIFDPEIFKYDLKEEDKIIVFGTDGFWKYLNNDEVIKIVGDYYEDGIKAEEASIKIAEIAKDRWIEENKKNPSLFGKNNNNIDKEKNKKNHFIEYNFTQNYEQKKEKKYYYDDITCMVIYLDIK